MSEDSPDSVTELRSDDPLFRLEAAGERFESVIYSLLVVFAAFLFAGMLVILANSILEGSGLSEESAPVLSEVTLTAMNFLGLLVVSLWYLHWRDDWSLIGLRRPTKRDFGVIVAGSLVLIGSIVALDVVLSEVGLEPDENVAVQTGREHPELFLYYIPIVLLLNAPAEELLFRGVVQGLFRRAYGVVPGILAASVIFGFIHYVALAGDGSALAYVGIAVISGIVLGTLYEYTDNLLVPTIVHAAWNILVYLNLYAETTGILSVTGIGSL